MRNGFPDQEYQSAAVQCRNRQKIQDPQIHRKHQGDIQHIHQYILPAVVFCTFVGFSHDIHGNPDRSCHILSGYLPLHQHRQALPGHRHAITHLIPGITEAVQSGQLYKIRVTDADHITSCTLIILRSQGCSSFYSVTLILYCDIPAPVGQRKQLYLFIQMNFTAIQGEYPVSCLQSGFLCRTAVHDLRRHRITDRRDQIYHNKCNNKSQNEIKYRSCQHRGDPRPYIGI